MSSYTVDSPTSRLSKRITRNPRSTSPRTSDSGQSTSCMPVPATSTSGSPSGSPSVAYVSVTPLGSVTWLSSGAWAEATAAPTTTATATAAAWRSDAGKVCMGPPCEGPSLGEGSLSLVSARRRRAAERGAAHGMTRRCLPQEAHPPQAPHPQAAHGAVQQHEQGGRAEDEDGYEAGEDAEDQAESEPLDGEPEHDQEVEDDRGGGAGIALVLEEHPAHVAGGVRPQQAAEVPAQQAVRAVADEGAAERAGQG